MAAAATAEAAREGRTAGRTAAEAEWVGASMVAVVTGEGATEEVHWAGVEMVEEAEVAMKVVVVAVREAVEQTAGLVASVGPEVGFLAATAGLVVMAVEQVDSRVLEPREAEEAAAPAAEQLAEEWPATVARMEVSLAAVAAALAQETWVAAAAMAAPVERGYRRRNSPCNRSLSVR